jgi:hypothetical protein
MVGGPVTAHDTDVSHRRLNRRPPAVCRCRATPPAIGAVKVHVPRHSEIAEGTAASIIRTAEEA